MATMLEPLSLMALDEIARSVSDDSVGARLLSTCILEDVRVYFPVPPGHVVANFETAIVDRRTDDHGARPIVKYMGPARVEHQIRWIVIDPIVLKQILDAGSVNVEQHFDGGLVDCEVGLKFRHLNYCVIRKDSPRPPYLPADPRPEMLNPGVVFPTNQKIRFGDLFISRKDREELIKAIQPGEVADKWGHKASAPHVYRLYSISQETRDMSEIVSRLIADDESGVFTQTIATAAARILNIDVGEHALERMKFDAIRENEVKKDYSDPSLSKRMSLVLLATDCWLHDQALREESEKLLQAKVVAVELARKKKPGSAELKRLETELADATFAKERELSSMRYMRSGLRKYLEELGFSGNQASQLERIIVGKKVGGVHVRTQKRIASITKARTMKQGQS